LGYRHHYHLSPIVEQHDMLGGFMKCYDVYYRCPACHYFFTDVKAKHDHIHDVHPEAAELYIRDDPIPWPVLDVYDVPAHIPDDSQAPAA
jgi:hypothetical protein